MKFLHYILNIFALVGLSASFMTGMNRIYSTDQIYLIPSSLSIVENPASITYMISFPQTSGNVTVMAFPASQINNVESSSCPIVHYSAYWHRTLSMYHPECKMDVYDGIQRMIRCDGKFEITDYNYGTYVFALSSCGPMGLKDTLYDMNSQEMPMVSAAAQFSSLSALLCFLIIHLLSYL